MKTLRTSVLLLVSFVLVACVERSDGRERANSQAADIIVTGEGPSPKIASGDAAIFNFTVKNAGPGDAPGVDIVDTVGRQSKLVSITCKATGSAVCPSRLQATMRVPDLPAGGALEFAVTLRLADSVAGTVINSMVASYARDNDPNNNSVTVDASVR